MKERCAIRVLGGVLWIADLASRPILRWLYGHLDLPLRGTLIYVIEWPLAQIVNVRAATERRRFEKQIRRMLQGEE